MEKPHEPDRRPARDQTDSVCGPPAETSGVADFSLLSSILRKLGKDVGAPPQVALPPLAGDEGSHRGEQGDGAGTGPPGRQEHEGLGRYLIRGEIGRGGVGVVFRVHDADLGRDLALKVLIESEKNNPDALRRFVEEAQIGGQLQHPGIVPVHEMGIIGEGTPYFTMRLVKGQTLAALLKKRCDPADELQRFLSIFERAAQTLAYAHARGVMHRDLKPANIMIGAFGEVHVMDWGLSKVLSKGGIHDELHARSSQAQTQLTEIHTIRSTGSGSDSLAGAVMGTPAYMSPEQARGEVEALDQRSDVFGLGAILCEVLTGTPPYVGSSVQEIHRLAASASLDGAYERLDTCGADPQIVALARTCLAPEPRGRPRDAGGVAKVMRAYFDAMDEKTRAAEVDAAEALARAEGERKARRLELVIAVVLLLAIGIAGGVYAKLEFDRHAHVERATADAEAAIAAAIDLRGHAKSAAGEAQPARWAEVVAAATRARGLAEKEDVPEDVRRRAHGLLDEARRAEAAVREAAFAAERDRRMIERLESIRLIRDKEFLVTAAERQKKAAEEKAGQESAAGGGGEERSGGARDRDRRRVAAYDKEFQQYFTDGGATWDTAQPAAMADHIGTTVIRLHLVRALDDWALASRRLAAEEGAGAVEWQRYLTIALRADPDPLRVTIRHAVEARNLEDLKALADALPRPSYGLPGEKKTPGDLRPPSEKDGQAPAPDTAAPPLTYDLLAGAFLDAGATDRAISALEQGHCYHPGDLWINHRLAIAQAMAGGDSIPYFSAVLALRKSNPRAWLDLGAVLARSGDLDDAVASLEEAVRRAADEQDVRAEALERLAGARGRSGDLEGAVRAYRDLLEITPDDAGILLKLGQTLTRTGDLKDAISVFRRAVDVRPDDPEAHRELGAGLLENGSPQDALGPLRRGCRIAPKSAELRFLLGVAAMRSGRLDEAFESLTEAVALDPGDARSHLKLAVAGARLDRLGEAIAQLKEAVRLRPDMAAVDPPSSGRALATAEASDYESLRDALANAAEGTCDDAELLALLGVLNLRAGNRIERAIPAFTKALELAPKNTLSAGGLGLAYLRQGRLDEAIATLDRCLALEDKDRAARNNRAVALHRKGRTDDAVAELRLALRLEPQEPTAPLNLGLLLLKQQNLAEAEQAFRAAVLLDVKNVEAHILLGNALYEQGRYRSALPVLYTALELAPQNQRALSGIGKTVGQMGRLEEAVSVLEKSLQLDPDDAVACNALGIFQFRRGAIDAATAALEKARELDPKLWRASFNLGRAHLAETRYQEALDAFRNVTAIEPENDEAFSEILSLLKMQDAALGDAVPRLVTALSGLIDSATKRHPDAAEAFLLAWSRAPESLDPGRPLELAAGMVEATRGTDPRALALMARVQRAAGAMTDAVMSLEAAAELPTATVEIAKMLEDYRRAALPLLLTYESVDAALDQAEYLVPAGAPWRYFRGTAEPSVDLAWIRRDFEDGRWREGPSAFGYKQGGFTEGTTLEDMLGSYTTVYLRRRFHLPEPDRYERVLVSVKTGDAFVAYVNAREIGRKNADAFGVRLPHDATADVTEPAAAAPGTETESVGEDPLRETVLEIPRDCLVVGENVAAIQGVNSFRVDLDFFLLPTVQGVPTAGYDAERFAAFREKAHEAGAGAVLAYLEGRMLQRAGKRSEAAKRFREALTADPQQPRSLQRLAESLDNLDELEQAFHEVRAQVKGGKLRPWLLVRLPEKPVSLAARVDAAAGKPGTVVLQASPFFCFDDGATHRKSHWQIRAEGADYARNPTFDAVRADSLTSLTVVAGHLLPRTTYFFRVQYWSSGGAKSALSEERSFTTGDFPFAAVPFDLSSYFNRDIVGNPGDPENEVVHRGGTSGAFTVDGFDGQRADNPDVRGLPLDRVVGVHRLGDYSGPNAIQLTRRHEGALRIPVPRGRYVCLRFLTSTGYYMSRIPATFEFADGGTQEACVPSDDWWFGTPTEDLQEGSHPVYHAMTGIDAAFKQPHRHVNLALYEVVLPVHDDRELVAIVLKPKDGFFTIQNTTFNLFAITGMKLLERAR